MTLPPAYRERKHNVCVAGECHQATRLIVWHKNRGWAGEARRGCAVRKEQGHSRDLVDLLPKASEDQMGSRDFSENARRDGCLPQCHPLASSSYSSPRQRTQAKAVLTCLSCPLPCPHRLGFPVPKSSAHFHSCLGCFLRPVFMRVRADCISGICAPKSESIAGLAGSEGVLTDSTYVDMRGARSLSQGRTDMEVGREEVVSSYMGLSVPPCSRP